MRTRAISYCRSRRAGQKIWRTDGVTSCDVSIVNLPSRCYCPEMMGQPLPNLGCFRTRALVYFARSPKAVAPRVTTGAILSTDEWELAILACDH
jgi:hypothetical protein